MGLPKGLDAIAGKMWLKYRHPSGRARLKPLRRQSPLKGHVHGPATRKYVVKCECGECRLCRHRLAGVSYRQRKNANKPLYKVKS